MMPRVSSAPNIRLKKSSPMGENAVGKAMTEVRFDAVRANRSYLGFFMGFGWSIRVAMLLQSMCNGALGRSFAVSGGERLCHLQRDRFCSGDRQAFGAGGGRARAGQVDSKPTLR
jgi:hypothetical protein